MLHRKMTKSHRAPLHKSGCICSNLDSCCHLTVSQRDHEQHGRRKCAKSRIETTQTKCSTKAKAILEDVADHFIFPIRESIITRRCSGRRSRHSERHDEQVPSSKSTQGSSSAIRCEKAIQRIAQKHRRQSWLQGPAVTGCWSLVAFINLFLLLAASHQATGAIASHPHSQTHRNHSNQSELPSHATLNSAATPQSDESIISSLLASSSSSSLLSLSSGSTLLLEELLQERTLKDAIHKLTNAWNQVHGSSGEASASSTEPHHQQHHQSQTEADDPASDQMISSHQVKLVTLYLLAGADDDKQENAAQNQTHAHSRERRWTKTQNKRTRAIKSNQVFSDDDMMAADDSRVYQHLASSNRTNRNNHAQSHQGKSNSLQPAAPSTGNCTRCRLKEEARSLRIESIKFNILNKLGMKHAPNVSIKSVPKIPPLAHILEKYSGAMMLGDDPRPGNSHQKRYAEDHFGPVHSHDHDQTGDEFFVNAQKSIVFAQQPLPERAIQVPEHKVQYFKFPANIINSHVDHATIWVYLKANKSVPDKAEGQFFIYKVTSLKPYLLEFAKRSISSNLMRRGGWIKIDVKHLISSLFQNPEEDYGLVVHALESSGGYNLNIIRHDDVSMDSPLRPFIEVVVSTHHTESIRRKRMATMTCDDKSAEVRCCRYPLTIDFESFGWEWVIAPKRYSANYCSGECDPHFAFNGYPHTHLVQQTLYNPTGPCCSPRKMSPISMLYMNSDFNIIYGILPNMVVDMCDCS